MGWKIVHETCPVLATELLEANELIYSTLKALSVKPLMQGIKFTWKRRYAATTQ